MEGIHKHSSLNRQHTRENTKIALPSHKKDYSIKAVLLAADKPLSIAKTLCQAH